MAPDTNRERAAGGLNTLQTPQLRADLSTLSLSELSAEVFARLAAGATYQNDADLVLAGQLADALAPAINVHLNRFSRRRLYDVTRPVLDVMPAAQRRNATIVDLGSGSLNPLVFGFVFLMLGARRAYSIDLEPMQNPERSIKALAEAAAWMLVDPRWVVGDHAIPGEEVLHNLAGFHLPSLSAGLAGGLDDNRLIHRVESIYDLSVGDGEADLVSTVSLLEHVDRPDDAVRVLQRITAPGGIGHHIIDFVDHRHYVGQTPSVFDFLKIDTPDAIVHGSNRLRASEFCRLFERCGFEVLRVDPARTETVSAGEQAQFVEPYRSMSADELSLVCARMVVRRR